MKHRHALPVLLLLALAVAVPALAARPVPTPVALPGTPAHVRLLQPRVDATCALGVYGEGAWGVDYLLPPNDSYYTLLDPAACGCSAAGVFLANAHVSLYYPNAACDLPVSISIVAADLTTACPVPLPDQVICPPVSYTLPPASAGLWDFCMGLSAPCCVSTKVFLKVTFDGVGTCTELPRLVTTDGCEPCVSYNGYPSGMDELCGVGLPGNPRMWVQAACCDVVSAHGSTWGRLKTLYR
jgi:hypothetical protein